MGANRSGRAGSTNRGIEKTYDPPRCDGTQYGVERSLISAAAGSVWAPSRPAPARPRLSALRSLPRACVTFENRQYCRKKQCGCCNGDDTRIYRCLLVLIQIHLCQEANPTI